MDPDVALRQIRAIAGPGVRDEFITPQEAMMMAEAFRSLDLWLASGGFRPKSWQRVPECPYSRPECMKAK